MIALMTSHNLASSAQGTRRPAAMEKRKRDYEYGADVVNATLSRLEASASESDSPAFIPSPRFSGARPGYYFSAGKAGVGYYADASQPAAARKIGAAVKAPEV
jgi:hypothetical protein